MNIGNGVRRIKVARRRIQRKKIHLLAAPAVPLIPLPADWPGRKESLAAILRKPPLDRS